MYLELRHTAYYRTDPNRSEADRIAQMRDIVRMIGANSYNQDYPLLMRQILCMHSRLPYAVNKAIVELAASEPSFVCGIDLAGPDTLYGARLEEFIGLFQYACSLGLKTTCHLFETTNGFYPQLLPYLNRIGHGIQIPLRFPELLDEVAQRGQCLEVCPTSYLKTGTLEESQRPAYRLRQMRRSGRRHSHLHRQSRPAQRAPAVRVREPVNAGHHRLYTTAPMSGRRLPPRLRLAPRAAAGRAAYNSLLLPHVQPKNCNYLNGDMT